MAKFNTSTTGSTKTHNHEGGSAYTMPADLDLYATVVTTFLEDKFYESNDERIKRIRTLVEKVAKNDPKFIAQLSVYAREQMNLRSVPMLLTCLLTEHHNGDDLVRRTTRRVVRRADEISEMLACYAALFGDKKSPKKLNKLSKQLQKGLADVFSNFDEYQFAKYNRGGDVKLRDALFLTHPNDIGKQTLFDKIAKDELSTPETWETKMSAVGQTAKTEEEKVAAKKEQWEDMVNSRKIGYMALLRNVRNMLDANVAPDVITKLCERLADPNEVRNSKQFPFRFLAAYQELEDHKSPYAGQVMEAIDAAAKASVDNLPGFSNEQMILIAGDVSVSMSGTISKMSKIKTRDVAVVLASLLREKCRTVTTAIFADQCAVVNTPRGSIMASVEAMRRKDVGGSTNGFLVPAMMNQLGIEYDKVFIFTDCEFWDSTEPTRTRTPFWGGNMQAHNSRFKDEWMKYKKDHPRTKLYLFNLAGYGTTPISVHNGDVYCIAGWSEKIFSIIDSLDRGSTVLDEIRKIEL